VSPFVKLIYLIIDYGSSGTVVYMSTFQGRAVATKRLLKVRVPFADRKVNHLMNVHHHQNIIHCYFCRNYNPNYFDITLELCSASLFNIMERRDGDDGPKHAEFRVIA